MSEDLGEALEEGAVSPSSVTMDGISVQQRPLPDLIQVDQYLLRRRARLDPRLAIYRAKIIPPGSV